MVFSTTGATCLSANAGPGTIVSQANVSVGGSIGTQYVLDGEGREVVINVEHGHCYDLWFYTNSQSAREANLAVIDLIASHFTFGS